ncbi:MAG TPA: TolC family protein [Candidatus Binataceae bacterium]|nr:TolC family protein [Candidatus Binataceae bacterium]
MRFRFVSIVLLFLPLSLLLGVQLGQAGGEVPLTPITVEQLVQAVLRVNPQVQAARARWNSAVHQIKQNYVPADPTFNYSNLESSKDFNAAAHAHAWSDNFQFPGKALLQGDQAKRTAEIARLTYEATCRDTRAAAETGYYQALLDAALADATTAQVADLGRVLKVTQVNYETNQAAQTDVISAQFDYSTARQQEEQLLVSALNDKRQLNQLLFRHADSPLLLDRRIKLMPLKVPLDRLVEQAAMSRQEILQTALSEKNNETALTLAKMEYLPDYSLAYEFDYLLQPGAQPLPNVTQGNTFSIGFNMPIFFWWKQREDVTRAKFDLAAARDDLGSITSQTEIAVTRLYSQAQLSYKIALTYRDYLVALARQDFNVALIAYQSGKIQFPDLSGALQRSYNARIAYLQAENQFLAQVVALEQAVGEPLSQ